VMRRPPWQHMATMQGGHQNNKAVLTCRYQHCLTNMSPAPVGVSAPAKQ
jgi:hypothetical protein